MSSRLIFTEQLLEEQKYWTRRLAGAATAPPSNIFLDGRRASVYSKKGASVAVEVPAEVRALVSQLTGGSPLLVYTLLMSALKVCLHKYTGEGRVVVGSPAHRAGAETDANALVIVDDLDGGLTFRQLLVNVRQTLSEAYRRQQYPFHRLVRDLGLEAVRNKCPLFDIALAHDEIHGPLPDVRNDITIRFGGRAEELAGVVEYNARLFTRETVGRFAAHFINVLRAALQDTSRPLRSLELVAGEERRLMLSEWNDTADETLPRACVHRLFERQAARTPEAVAATFEGEQVTYAELDRRADLLARRLRAHGVGPDVPVGILSERSLEMMVAVLGVLKAGGAYLPLDAAYPRERLAFMLEDAAAPVILTQKRLLDTIPAGRARVVVFGAEADTFGQDDAPPAADETLPDNLAYVIYTSGSTGRPKGVAMSHAALSNLVLWQCRSSSLAAGQRSLQFTSLSFDVSFQEMFSTWCVGGTLVVVPEALRRDPARLARFVAAHEIERLFMPFVALQQLADASALQEQNALRLREVITAGEQLRVGESVASFFRRAGGCALVNQYGPTESHVVTAHTLDGPPSRWPALPPIGRPLPNTEIYILDANMHLAPVGVPGELHIGGRALARGYLNRPDLTAEKFVPHPFAPTRGERLYKTGDLARFLPDGNVEFLGRVDHQIKIRGHRVELGEIEATLARHPRVREAVVTARDDESFGGKRLVAYFIPSDGAEAPDEADLRAFLRGQLPAHMLPSDFVSLRAWPLTPSGKVDRRALPEPVRARGAAARPDGTPRDLVEEALVEMWREALGAEQVGINSNFFDLGGHSLLATQLIHRVQETFEVELPMQTFFEAPTVAGQAAHVAALMSAGGRAPAPPVEPVPRGGRLPLSFAQQRLWFLDRMEEGRPLYHIPGALRITGALDVAALEQAVNEVVRRHEILRTTFAEDGGTPFQNIAPTLTLPLPLADLRHLPADEREGETLRRAREEAARPFDLARGPLIRVSLLRLGDTEHVFLVTMHHIVSDGWSVGVLAREMAALYENFSRGGRPALAPLPIQYADFAHWQREWLRGEVLEAQLDYWKRRLAGAPPLLELHVSRPRPAVQTFHGAAHAFALPEELTRALREAGRRNGVTLFMLLLAAFKALLHRYSGQEDVVVGTPVANRRRPELEGLIGFFVNTLVLRTDLSGGPTFRELLGRVRGTALGAYAHQDVPFEKLVEELRPARNLTHSPLFQVLFALQNAPAAPLQLAGVRLELLEAGGATVPFDLSCEMSEEGERLAGLLRYNTDLFRADDIERLAGHFRTLLEAAAREPETRLADLPLLTADERRRLSVEWNDTAAEVPADKRIHQLFEARADAEPGALALMFQDERLTYDELNRRANRLAHALRSLGVTPETSVAVYLERSAASAVALLAILKAGGAYVPLDPEQPRERVAFMLRDARARVVLTQEALLPGLPEVGAEVVCLDDCAGPLAHAPETNPENVSKPGDAAYLIYTSGTTGEPKAVTVEHRQLLNTIATSAAKFGFAATDVVPVLAPFVFDISLFELLTPLSVGGAARVFPKSQILDPAALADGLKTATVLHAVPSLMRQILDLWPDAGTVKRGEGGADVPARPPLRRLFVGGDVVPPELLRRMREAFPAAHVNVLYGPTEAAIICLSREVGDAAGETRHVIGRPLGNVEVRVCDSRHNLLPVGLPGELYIGGAGVARGYHERDELTRDKFILLDGRRFYRSGDRALYLPDGEIEFLGRVDEQVKVRGFRVEPGEVESALKGHEGVRDCVVVARADADGEKRLVAYVVGREGRRPEPAELHRFLAAKVPAYMIPAAFVTLDRWPLTPNGKLDRAALPPPAPRDGGEQRRETRPPSPVEQMLASLWQQLLNLGPVGPDDDFFESGGHSLLATQLVSRVREVFGVRLPVRAVFDAPTLEGMARHVDELLRADAPAELEPVERAARGAESPVSFAQRRLWFLNQLVPGNPAYNIPGAVRLSGRLDAEALGRALDAVVERHEVLRTSFGERDGEPVQIVSPSASLGLAVRDLRGLPPARREEEVRRLSAEAASAPLDLSQSPLARALLLRVEDDEHVLLLTMHHIVSDGWSMGVLIREVGAFYAAALEGKEPPLAPLPIQYADFAHWQRRRLAGEAFEAQLDYWRKQLAGIPAPPRLPADYPRPAAQSFRGATLTFRLPRELSAALLALARREGVTLFMALLAAFKVLLYRYTTEEQIVVGTSIANRNRAELEDLIGFFANMLVLRTDMSGGPTFRELLRRVRETALGAYAHQDVPFEKLVEELRPARDLARTPFFQIVFALLNAPAPPLELPGLTLAPMEVELTTSKFDLCLYMTETEEGLLGRLEYDTTLFAAQTVGLLVEHFRCLLEAVVAEPEAGILRLPLLGAAESRGLLAESGHAETCYPRGACVHELFEAQARETPHATALVNGDGRLTYDELNRRANRLARRLRALGVGPEVRVGVCVERSFEMVVAVLGVLKAGGAYVPLDPSDPQHRLLFVLENAGVGVLLTQRSLADTLPAHAAPVVSLDEEGETIGEGPGENLSGVGVAPENLAYVMYTSGSTGRPKGVAVAHLGVVRLVRQDAYARFAPDEVFLQFAPVTFDASTFELWGALLNGASLVLPPPRQHSLAELARLVTAHGVTTLWLTAGLFHRMVDDHLEELASLRRLLAGGDVLSVAHVSRFLAAAPSTTLVNGYGPTEGTTFTCCHAMRGAQEFASSVPIGRPIAGTRAYVLDDALRPVGRGVAGELYIAGDGLARGYLDRPDLTAERFLPDPFAAEAGARMYRSGDVVRRLAAGDIEFVGRADEQVKIRGFRVEPGEVEAVLARHGAVRDCAVVARGGGDERRLVGYVVARGGDVSVVELREYLRARLPEYMVPAAFVLLDGLPLTPNGKVDRRALPEPERAAPDAARFVAPRTDVEKALAEIWEQVLGVERVGAFDDFFDLGGHSLLATQVVSRVKKVLRAELPLDSIFEEPRVAGLARLIEAALRRGADAPAEPIEPVARDERLPLSFAQRRLWFLDKLVPDNWFYNITNALGLSGPLDEAALADSLREIVRRHESLRTTFAEVEGEPVQVVSRDATLEVPLVDLSALPEARREAEAVRLIHAEGRRTFSLSAGPLLRATLLRLGEREHVLLVVLHHIVGDGWSVGVFVEEMTALYAAFARGEASPLAPLPIQYADFAHWQHRRLAGEVLDKQMAYWKEQLRDAATLELPTDRPRPQAQSYRGARREVRFPPELLRALKRLGRAEGATLFMTLLAAFQVLLGRYAGQSDVSVGSPVANRNRLETERLIGFFVNMLVLRADLSGDPTFGELLRRTRETTLAAYAHQDVPFEKLVEELQPERRLGGHPLYQVSFVLQNAPSSKLELGAAEVRPLDCLPVATHVDLELNLWEDGDALAGHFIYSTDLFDDSTVARMAAHFGALLEAVAASPGERVSRINFLRPDERLQLLERWSATEPPLAARRCLHREFELRAARSPASVALVYEGARLSYGELNARANQLARHLRARGVRPETPVGLLLERSAEMVVAVLAVLKAGGAYVPLDPAGPAGRIAFMSRDAGLNIVLTRAGLLDLLPAEGFTVVRLDADWPEVAAHGRDDLEDCVGPDNLAYVLYTSGSTGRPKGVLVSHASVGNYVAAIRRRYALPDGASYAMLQPLTVDSSVTVLYGSLLSGGTLHLIPAERAADASAMADYFARHPVACLKIAPSHLAALHDWPRPEQIMPRGWLIIGGEASRQDWVERLRALAPGCRVFNHYGPTEATVGMLTHEAGAEPTGRGTFVPLGRPLAGAEVYVLDDGQEPVPAGVSGELYVGGACLARGYLNRPDLTAEKFVPHPFGREPGARLYRTGDAARFTEDGQVEFIGRRDEQVKMRGFRVEPGEVETALREQPGVREAVVVAHDGGGSRGSYLVAYFVAEAGAEVEEGELRRRLKERLPDYMLPAAVVRLDEMPRTAHGKLNRRALPDPGVGAGRQRDFAAPRTLTEEVLCGIWGEVLKTGRVGVEDDFFDLGGHSLMATQVVARVRRAFGVDLPLRALFESPTVAGLAGKVDALAAGGLASRHARPPIERAARDGRLPLSFAQERLWLVSRINPANAAYNNLVAMRLRGPLNVAALEQSFNTLVARHEVLRTSFPVVEGRPVQMISPAAPFKLSPVKLEALPEAERRAEVTRLARLDSATPFDLSTGPVLRVRLLALGAQEHALLLTIHHIATDGWTMRILVGELAKMYDAFSRGASPALPEQRLQYADYAAWERSWLRGETLEKHLEYWTEKLAGAPPALTLPTDYPPAGAPAPRGAVEAVELPAELADALRALGRRQNATLFAVMLAALDIVLFRWSGQGDIVTGTVVANRGAVEAEGMVGCFMNFLPLRATLSADESGLDLLARLRQTVMEAYHHQDCPFEKIVEAVNPERTARRNPLYNVAFLLQNFPAPVVFSESVEAEPLPVEKTSAMLDLTFVAEEHERGIRFSCEYTRDLFEAATVGLLLDFYADALRRLAADPSQPLSAYTPPEGLVAGRARAEAPDAPDFSVVVAATFTAEPVADTLAYWLEALELQSRVEFAPYNQVVAQLLDPSSLVSGNENGVNVVLLRLEDWGPRADAAPQDAGAPFDDLRGNVADLLRALRTAAARARAPFIVCLCPRSRRALANPAYAAVLDELEGLIASESGAMNGVYVVTAAEVAGHYPVEDYEDVRADALGHIPYRPAYFAALGTMLARKICALDAEPYKVLALDCDNTLWAGVCGEDGPLGVRVTPHHRALQEFVVAQHDAGMLVCLCSKNNPEDVLAVFDSHPDMVLKPHHIAAARVNWRPKPENLRSLAREFGVGLGSFVFIEDDAVECHAVESETPEVLVLQLPREACEIPKFLKNVWAFDRLKVTDEDRARTELYRHHRLSEEVREDSATLAEFLASIRLDVSIAPAEPEQIPRVAELTKRTNQFNLTAVRRSEHEILQMLRRGSECLTVRVSDRFGDYGLVGVVMFDAADDALRVDTFLLSCRALGRGVEHRMLNRLGEIALARGLSRVELAHRPNGRNTPARDFLTGAGAPFEEDAEGNILARFDAGAAASLRPPGL